MSSTEFKNRVYGCVVVKAINANYNADFNGLPRRLKSDGSFYATDKSFKWLVRNYIKKNQENEKILFTKQLNENFEAIDLDKAFDKLEQKENVLFTLLECIDVRLFGATFTAKGKNLSLHGVVQVNHATDLFGKGKVYTDEILAPFTAIGSMSKATEVHYIHNFSINPKNLSNWKSVIKKKEAKKEKTLLDNNQEDSLNLLSSNDIIVLKNAFNNAATFYDSHSKSGVENELSIYVTLNENSILTLPSFTQFIKFKKGENGEKNSFDLSELISYLNKYNNEIASIEIYVIEELIDLIYDSQNLNIQIFDLSQTV
ncbi:type I CRISPR-associated protein Cas7 [Halarcobacter sp.]|uniref:type I CRISPR-associated protein Cas7 n=1 Tax=Halarcobacter sp. TaxID=2321133 RepID=UPI0029F5572E|nr:type I CRISPR-associated protein Cas7 [Halarcobacter sp.]